MRERERGGGGNGLDAKQDTRCGLDFKRTSYWCHGLSLRWFTEPVGIKGHTLGAVASLVDTDETIS